MASRNTHISMVKKFEQKDKKALLEMCQQASKEVVHKLKNSQLSDIKKSLYQLCWHATFGKLQPENAVSVLTEVANFGICFANMIIDALGSLDIACQAHDNSHARVRYLSLLTMCCGKIVPESTLKERLDFETLGDSNIIRYLKNSQTKFIKMKTRLFYKQQKFNLFREESEGYAKLIVELNPGVNSNMHAKYAVEVTKSLIGCFNLDPNRVLDIILESFEHRPEMYDFFIFLLRSFSCTSSTLSQVIGFKFGFYQGGLDKTPKALYRLTALLLKEELLNLNNIYGLLMPEDSKILEKQKEEMADAQLYMKQLNSTAVSIDKANSTKPPTEEVPMELEDDDDNQKLGLCAALLDVGDWKNAEKLMGLFPEFYAVSHDLIAKKVCTLAHILTEKMYMQNSYSIFITQGKKKWQLDSNIAIKEVETFPELFEHVFPMLVCLGPYLHLDPILMAKVIRLSRQWMQQKNKSVMDSNMEAIIDVVDRSLLPSLSLMDCNCCMAEELWNLLKLFPYQIRYCLYSQWKTSTISSHPLLIKKRADSLKRLKYIMKRLSKENVKPSGRQIGKLSHTSPGDLFDYILSQIQTWDNFIVPVVDSLKYLTSLSYDVLAYCIMEALANPEKDRMKHDGTSISVWLQSLASFGGTVFKKYPIDIAGLLQYVGNQQKKEKSLDLLILKEIVQKMAGIEASEEMTSEQVEAMTGGELLRTEGGYFNQLRNVKKSSQRLKEALLDQGLAIPLCLLMAQQRQGILFGEQEQSHIKLIGKLYDQCQDTLVQFGSFLASNLNMDDYISRVPSISALFSEYHINSDVAFFLVRPTFNFAINEKFEELKQDRAKKSLSNTQKYIDAVQLVVDPILESIWADPPFQNWDDLSPQIYVTFWSLSVYDLCVPTESYEREIAKLKVLAQGEENKDVNKKKKEKERCDALIAKLIEEEKMQHDHVALVTARLKHEKDNWFNTIAPKTETITQFLQQCLFPRCIFTPVDAIYCAKFLLLVHDLKTPNFSTLLCYDRIFCDITTTVAFCTENQANRYGLFLCTMLETVMRWHNDRSVFDQECAFFPGFMTKFKGAATQGAHDSSDHVDYENYRHVCHKWHFKITRALLNCLDSGDFILIRNALLVLIKLSPHFPVVTNLGSAVESRIQKIKTNEKDKRPDLYALATGYSGILKSRKSAFIHEGEFHLKELHRAFTKPDSQTKPENIKSTRVETSRTSASSKSTSDKQISVSSSSNTQSTRSKSKEVDHNGVVETVRINRTSSSSRLKEDKNDTSSSPMRREDRLATNKSDSKEEKSSRDRRSAEDHEKSSTRSATDKDSNDSSGRDAHSHRRSNNDVGDSERDHKRRRIEIVSSKSPRDSERELRTEKTSKDDEKNNSSSTREKSSEKSVKGHKESSETNSEKLKLKDKKLPRKRDYSNEDSVQDQPRRRRAKTDEDVDKRSDTRREDKSPLVYIASNNQESSRRTDRDEKKHRRSSSVTVAKKRS